MPGQVPGIGGRFAPYRSSILMENIIMKSNVRKSLISAAILAALSFGTAHAGGVAGAVEISGYTGSVAGSTIVQSSGSALAVSTAKGNAASSQIAEGAQGAKASIGGHVTSSGAAADVASSQYATSRTVGSVRGNAPVEAPDGLLNGSAVSSEAKASAIGSSQFNKAGTGIAGAVAIQAIRGAQPIAAVARAGQ